MDIPELATDLSTNIREKMFFHLSDAARKTTNDECRFWASFGHLPISKSISVARSMGHMSTLFTHSCGQDKLSGTEPCWENQDKGIYPPCVISIRIKCDNKNAAIVLKNGT